MIPPLIKIPEQPIALVTWHDAHIPNLGWSDKVEVEAAVIKSIGYAFTTEEDIVLIADYSIYSDSVGRQINIPLSCIRKIVLGV